MYIVNVCACAYMYMLYNVYIYNLQDDIVRVSESPTDETGIHQSATKVRYKHVYIVHCIHLYMYIHVYCVAS